MHVDKRLTNHIELCTTQPNVKHCVTGPFGGLWLCERCPVTVRDLLYWGITTTQRRTSGRLIRSGDLHSTTPKQNSTFTVMTQIAITILAWKNSISWYVIENTSNALRLKHEIQVSLRSEQIQHSRSLIVSSVTSRVLLIRGRSKCGRTVWPVVCSSVPLSVRGEAFVFLFVFAIFWRGSAVCPSWFVLSQSLFCSFSVLFGQSGILRETLFLWGRLLASLSLMFRCAVESTQYPFISTNVTGPSGELWLYERCPVTVRDLLYWRITTTQPRTSGRLFRSGDLHSTTPKQNSTFTVMTQIAITILTNERWITRPAHQVISSRRKLVFRTSRGCYSLRMLTDSYHKLRFRAF